MGEGETNEGAVWGKERAFVGQKAIKKILKRDVYSL